MCVYLFELSIEYAFMLRALLFNGKRLFRKPPELLMYSTLIPKI